MSNVVCAIFTASPFPSIAEPLLPKNTGGKLSLSRYWYIPFLHTEAHVHPHRAAAKRNAYRHLPTLRYLFATVARAYLLTTIEFKDDQYSKWKPWLRSFYWNHHAWTEITNLIFPFFSPLIFFEIFNIQLQFLIGFELSSSRAFQICVDHLLTLSSSKVMIGVRQAD